MKRYADILIPLAVNPFTYEVGEELHDLCEGECVAVAMGSSDGGRFYTGIVWRVGVEKPEYERVRIVSRRVENGFRLSAEQRALWEWVARYYLSTLGEVMSVVLPGLIKPRALDEGSFERVEYAPSEESYISINQNIDELIARLERRAPVMYEAVEEMLSIEASYRTRHNEIPRRLLNSRSVTLKSLESKGIITITKRERNIESVGNISFALPELTPHQSEALAKIRGAHSESRSVLLHGITGSGKTEVYMHLIAEELAQGRDVMLLLPEIALTTQLMERMERIFGSRVTPYHSKLTVRRRTEIMLSLAKESQGGRFIVGARSAIFLPLNRLGLVVVDEEHDASYKQNDPSPRYNARDLAHIVAAQYGAKVVLGSATPSLESWTNARSGKFELVKLTERYGGAQLPTVKISDTRRAAKRGERRGHFNLDLYNKIEERLERGEQVMLFQNRRGFAPYVECRECGWVARCPNCNISLTMHKSDKRLNCHYCDYSMSLTSHCPTCKVGEVAPMGFGTEKIEEQLAQLFPNARTLRLDRDTSNSQRSFERIIDSFARHEADILVGTQMITKGFDFPNVTLVGILNADNTLQVPDFRAEERAYSLLTQVAGRAGRREGAEAEVIMQTTQPNHRVLKYVVESNYEEMALTLLNERAEFFYPPYARLLTITLKHNDNQRLGRSASSLATLLRSRFGTARVRGPLPPPVDRVMGEWILVFTLRIEAGSSSMRARDIMREIVEEWRKGGSDSEGVENRSIKLIFDVDPQ